MPSASDLPALDPPFKNGKGMISRVSPFTGDEGGGGGSSHRDVSNARMSSRTDF